MRTKNIFKTMLAAACCLGAVVFTSCDNDNDTKKSGLKLSASTATVAPGQSASIVVGNGTAPYKATSSDANIATAKVDSKTIIITGVKVGSALVTVTDANNLSGKIVVSVKEAAQTLSFDKSSVSIENGKEDVVTVKSGTAPYTATVKDQSIASATVKDAKITVKGLKAGTTTITVADKNKTTGTFTVTVK